MNFADLYKKISNLDKGITESQQLDECPCQDNIDQPPKQQDSVNMNVSINGQGANGIRDLMDILRNIDNDEQKDKHDVLIGEPDELETDMDDEMSEEEYVTDEYQNSEDNGPDKTSYAIDAVIGIGDDLASKGKGALKANGGENPWNVNESLVNHLKDLYEEVKNKSINEGRDGNYDLPGPGDVETWPRDVKSRKSHGVGKYHSDHEEPEYKQPERKDKPEVKWDNSKEGTAPNGERYNSRLLVKGTSELDIKNEIHLLEKHEWGAKKLVDVSKKETDNGVIGVLYIVDNHKYGMWRPWKDEEPIAKPFSWG